MMRVCTQLPQQVLDDYIPHLCGIIACVQSDELQFKYEPGELVFPFLPSARSGLWAKQR